MPVLRHAPCTPGVEDGHAIDGKRVDLQMPDVMEGKPGATRTFEGSVEAIEALYEQQSDVIFHLGLDLLGGDPEAARDLVQETFLAAFRAWGDFHGDARASTWLYTIARRTAWRMRRLRAGQPRHMERFVEDSYSTQPEREQDDPLAELIAEEESRRLHEALQALPAHYRLAVSLKELGGYSVAEVADALHLCEGTVKSRLHRGRNRLAGILAARDLADEAA